MQRLAIAATVASFVTLAVPVAEAGSISRASQLERAVIRQVNLVRARHGLPALRESRQLAAAAAAHSREIGSHGYFGHNSADGTDAISRIGRFYPRMGHRSWWVGENLFWSSEVVDARRVVNAWLASPSHRRQLLTRGYREIGASAVDFGAAPGIFGGMDVRIVAVDFGVRAG